MAVVSLLFAAIVLIVGIRAALRPGMVETGGLGLRGSAMRIRAVAYTSLAECLRMRVLWFIAALLVIALALAFQATGDGTIKGRVQAVVEYVLGLAALGMALVTLVVSTWSLSKEISGKQIWNTVSKPVPRWEIVIGKWIGVCALNVAMLALVTVAT